MTAEAIKWTDYSAYTGFDREIFKILNDPNKPKESAADVPSTSSQVNNSELSSEINSELLNIGEL